MNIEEIKERINKVSDLQWMTGEINSADIYWLIEQVEEQQKQIKVYEMQLRGALFNTDYKPKPKRTLQLDEE